jgi:hypothetical protein
LSRGNFWVWGQISARAEIWETGKSATGGGFGKEGKFCHVAKFGEMRQFVVFETRNKKQKRHGVAF